MKTLKFMITNTQYLQVTSDAIYEPGCCLACIDCDVDYIDETLGLTIRFGNTQANHFYGGFGTFNLIKDLAESKKILDKQINPDLGFEWNQFFQGILKNTDILQKYHFVSNEHKQIRPYYDSWFYNDEAGNIIFEITPFYPFHYETKKTHPDFITYKKWIKDYQPTVKIIVPKERVLEWEKQAISYHPACTTEPTIKP